MAVTQTNNMVGAIPVPYRTLTDAAGNAISPATSGLVATALTATFLEKSNATARVEGTSVGGVALSATSVPFKHATVTARKAVADIDKASIANVGTVWIGGAVGNIDGATPLEPGQSMALFDDGDLDNYFLVVESANDGVSIAYSA